MSIIGKQPVKIPDKVKVDLKKTEIVITGPGGNLTIVIPLGIELQKKDNEILVKRTKETKPVKSLHGTIRSLIQNAVIGVTDGWTKKLEVKGTGYKVEKTGDGITFKLGYSHPVEFTAPDGISFEVDKNVLTVKGINKELVGNTAAKIRKISPPDVYQGKGIRYSDEIVKLKPGKVAKVGGAGGAVGG